MNWICFEMIFSSISKVGALFGFGLGVGFGFGFGFGFFHPLTLYSPLSLPGIVFFFINLNTIWIWFGMVFSSISKGRCFGLDVGLVLVLGLVFFFSNSLLLSLTFRN